ncbi:MAG TPA: alpha/beta hydrolase [Thermoleophilaceae bacterium]|nr:alpha/beta hydrolase [Thermoleophilaceae bacterium]
MAKTLLLSKARPALPSAAERADSEYGSGAEPDWRQIDWREHLHWAEIEDKRMNYVDIGSGAEPPIVFIHGLSGCWQNWLENLPYFAQKRRCVAMDLPGFGHSDMPGEKISIRGYARHVDALCEQLELGRCIIVGNSMGGFVAAEVGIRHSERVERACLVAAAGISITNLRRRPLLTGARMLGALGATSASQSRIMVSRPRLRWTFTNFVFRHPSRIAPDLMFEQVMGAGKPGFVDALDALTSYDFRDRLPDIEAPTLIVWGEHDMLVPVEDAHEFERLIPQSRTVILDDTGHVPMLERPRKFNELLEELIEGRGVGAETGPEEQVTAA